jgi:hypothetical protein
MKAAIVRSYERGPEYGDFEEPIAKNDEILVTVKAAALSRLVQYTRDAAIRIADSYRKQPPSSKV